MSEVIEGQVSLAKLSTQIAVQTTQLNNIESLLKAIKGDNEKDHDAYEDKLESQGLDIARLKTTQSTLAWIQVGISALLSSIAGYIGIR